MWLSEQETKVDVSVGKCHYALHARQSGNCAYSQPPDPSGCTSFDQLINNILGVSTATLKYATRAAHSIARACATNSVEYKLLQEVPRSELELLVLALLALRPLLLPCNFFRNAVPLLAVTTALDASVAARARLVPLAQLVLRQITQFRLVDGDFDAVGFPLENIVSDTYTLLAGGGRTLVPRSSPRTGRDVPATAATSYPRSLPMRPLTVVCFSGTT